ncbi:hypothetical protein FACS189487_08060 [Campylobacterota bacterium]|nr:hypothetical protein FACS189487_08060 [Campylobacterota bacterium]
MKKYASKIYFVLISMKSMSALLFITAFACAAATFIENDYGSEAARAAVYNSLWFELVLFLLAFSLIANAVRSKMWRREKLPIFIFHISFLVILLGAAVTRYAGFEGTMHIREGETSNVFMSAEPYLKISSSGLNERWGLNPTAITNIEGEYTAYRLGGGAPVKLTTKAYYRFAEEAIVPVSENGREYVSALISFNSETADELGFFSGDCYDLKSAVMCFGEEFESDRPMIIVGSEDGQLVIRAYSDLLRTDMNETEASERLSLVAHTVHPFDTDKIYTTIDGISFALKNHYLSAERKVVESAARSGTGALIVDVEHKDEKREIALLVGAGMQSKPIEVELAGRGFTVSFGSEAIELPFSLRLDRFMAERYPGSEQPSSYESQVTLIDPAEKIEDPKRRIYMNHILIHKKFRFYQASYDRDERGTILSVSHDPGVSITYLGYTLLAFGFFAAFFSPKSRFRTLGAQIEKSRRRRSLMPLLFAAFVYFGANGDAIADDAPKGIVAKAHADMFDSLLVQDIDGRVKPFETFSLEALRKIARTDKFNTLTSTQVFLGMMSVPEGWQQIEMISLSHPDIAPMIGLPLGTKYAKFSDFFTYDADNRRVFKLDDEVYEARRTREAMRTKLQKELVKVYERIDICNRIYIGYLAQVIPVRDDPNFTWTSPGQILRSIEMMPQDEIKEATVVFFKYYDALKEAQISGDWSKADAALDTLKAYQRTYGAAVAPSEMRVKAELILNALDPFDWLTAFCFLLGFAALVFAFLEVLKPSREIWRDHAADALLAATAVIFAFHTFALGLRWFVSEHAPWSNGYESVIYIAWTMLLAGLVFARRSIFALPAAILMAAFALMVSHLSNMDPQITPLVPVLKSYWLTIHVSVISASYGFFGLCMLLGAISLVLFILRNPYKVMRDEAIAEIFRINEMAMMIGLALLTIGNFLGAIWANESWGRYWSWDPKETWTLVSMLVYAAILHFRFVPKFKSAFVFSFASVLAFGVILMTYFGVNFYLSGLHSYASGDPVPVPTWIFFVVPTIFFVGFAASRKSDGIYPLENR